MQSDWKERDLLKDMITVPESVWYHGFKQVAPIGLSMTKVNWVVDKQQMQKKWRGDQSQEEKQSTQFREVPAEIEQIRAGNYVYVNGIKAMNHALTHS